MCCHHADPGFCVRAPPCCLSLKRTYRGDGQNRARTQKKISKRKLYNTQGENGENIAVAKKLRPGATNNRPAKTFDADWKRFDHNTQPLVRNNRCLLFFCKPR